MLVRAFANTRPQVFVGYFILWATYRVSKITDSIGQHKQIGSSSFRSRGTVWELKGHSDHELIWRAPATMNEQGSGVWYKCRQFLFALLNVRYYYRFYYWSTRELYNWYGATIGIPWRKKERSLALNHWPEKGRIESQRAEFFKRLHSDKEGTGCFPLKRSIGDNPVVRTGWHRKSIQLQIRVKER